MLGVNVFQDFGNSSKPGKKFVVEEFLAALDRFNRHGQTIFFIQRGNDFGDGHPSPLIEVLFVKLAIPFA